jgi:ABC-type sugar transport system permease subunit
VSGWVDRLSDRQFTWLTLLPGLALVGIVVVPPVLGVLGLSFFRVELLRDDLRPFVGLHNFVDRLPADTAFLATIPRTVLFAAITSALAVPLALSAALLVHTRRRGGAVLGLLLLLPWAVAPIASGIFWRLVFDNSYGLVNDALRAVGIAPVRWNEAIPTLVVTGVATVWRAVPLLGVLLLAALRTVPSALGRAARMDGASSFQAFRYVTLPSIMPTLVVVTVLQVILSLQVFDVLFSITRGRPQPGGSLMGYSIFDTVINNLSLGYGAALTVVLGIAIAVCLGLLAVAFRRFRTSAGDAGAAGRGGSEDEVNEVGTGDGHGPLLAAALASGTTFEPRDGPPDQSRRARRPGLGWAWRAGRALVVVVLAVWFVGPIVWIAIASTQPEAALKAVPPALTTVLQFDGFTRLLNNPAWRGALVVSSSVALLATALALAGAVLTAYPLARFRPRGERALLGLLLSTQLMPPIALALPTLLLFLAFGLKDTILGLAVVNAAFWTPIVVWLARAAFLAVPVTIESAARLDGCGRLGTIFRVALPAARSGMAAAAILVFVGVWNDFVFAASIGDRHTQTLPRYLSITADPGYHILAAGILLTILPCVVLMAIFHRRILTAV